MACSHLLHLPSIPPHIIHLMSPDMSTPSTMPFVAAPAVVPSLPADVPLAAAACPALSCVAVSAQSMAAICCMAARRNCCCMASPTTSKLGTWRKSEWQCDLLHVAARLLKYIQLHTNLPGSVDTQTSKPCACRAAWRLFRSRSVVAGMSRSWVLSMGC